jgi:hypothetical protein
MTSRPRDERRSRDDDLSEFMFSGSAKAARSLAPPCGERVGVRGRFSGLSLSIGSGTLKRPLTRIALAMLRIASAIRPLPARGERLGFRRINRYNPVAASDFELGDNRARMTTFLEALI